jgi:HAD superfamily hydrolase (TIGR01509 family)
MLSIHPDARGLIFDCDGTLVDSMPIHWECWHGTFESLGASCPHDFLEEMKGVPTHLIIATFNERFGYDLDVDAFTEEKERRAKIKLSAVQPIEQVTALVYENRNLLPMAVASGGPRDTVLVSLDAVGLTGYFETIVTADDPVAPKPSPDIFLEAARRLGVSPASCQVFEDADMGLEAARAAGMIATDVRPFLA